MANRQSAVVRWGLLFGGIMALLAAITSVGTILLEGSIASGSPFSGLSAPSVGLAAAVVGCGLDLVYLALFFVAGIMTARQSGSVGAASLAGLLAGGFGALVNGVVTVTLTLLSPVLFKTSAIGGIGGAPDPETPTIVLVGVLTLRRG
jgi:hypothetical protein